jgi:hypothetical protein
MNRRDFLLFRTRGGNRVVELSCERLYMRCVDAQVTSATTPGREGLEDSWKDGWGEGEPPRVVHERTLDEIFQDLEEDLGDADVVCLVDTRWLASEELKERLDTTLSRFRARGGHVER